MGAQTTADAALSEEWLGRTDATLAFYRKLRDAFAPGKPLWLTETADAACGGNPSARTFLDTFRYLDQLGRLARQGVEVVAHNTLVASDYGLLDDVTLTPKPNYWGALLWRKLMDTKVLELGRSHPERSPPLCPLPARHARRRGAARHQQRPSRCARAHRPHARRTIHAVVG